MLQKDFNKNESKDPVHGSNNWKAAWQNPAFRKKIIIASGILLVILLFVYPAFFRYSEKRQGYLIHDWLLENIPAINVSVPVFICIWAAFLLFAYRVIKSPVLFKKFLLAYVLLSLSRILMIFLLPLEPPAGIIELKDPVISLFIGPKFIAKDLFFSGHTSTIFLLYLCFENKTDKWIAAGLALLTGVLLIIQHVHYTIDIAAAPLFAYICYRLTRGFGSKP